MKNYVLSLLKKEGLKVGIVGVGVSNLGVLDYLLRINPTVKLTLRSNTVPENCGIAFERTFFKADSLTDIDEDILFLSPSVRRDKKELLLARERGTLLFSDVELFFLFNSRDVYAVTGSDGKSTTTYLSSQLLSCSYESAIPSANFGKALSPHLFDTGNVAYVTELSSFQLMYLSPKVKRCVITNITQNHLDWHSSFEEYIRAKENILKFAEEYVFSYDSPHVREFARRYKPFALFSLDSTEKEMRRDIRAENYFSLDSCRIIHNGKAVIDTREANHLSRHNIANFMSAMALSYGKFEISDAVRLFRSFKGLSHRAELVKISDGVKYVNSSIDTTPSRTVATLSSLSQPIILILGGRSKGLDFGVLIPHILKKCRAVIMTGECCEEISQVLSCSREILESGIELFTVRDFEGAVRYAMKIAKDGDTVLLSPATTSYDRFKDFTERGNLFKNTVNGI